jgi:hypothetical protein
MGKSEKKKMIKPLRKRHLQIWSALLVLIPVGIVTAWLSIKHPVYSQLLQPTSGQALPEIVLSAEKPGYSVRLRANKSGAQQLEWINKDVLAVPSAVIYETTAEHRRIESAKLIGRIEAKGTYYFPLQKNSTNEKPSFILYDFIHEQIIDSINFQP